MDIIEHQPDKGVTGYNLLRFLPAATQFSDQAWVGF
jgi:hypothetical protein